MIYGTHYTRDEARALIPEVKEWLRRLSALRDQYDRQERQVADLAPAGEDRGGPAVNAWIRTILAIQLILAEFYKREIQIKDLDRGLVDFPSIRDGEEVFLCWENGEPDIAHWHSLDAGYAGREPLD